MVLRSDHSEGGRIERLRSTDPISVASGYTHIIVFPNIFDLTSDVVCHYGDQLINVGPVLRKFDMGVLYNLFHVGSNSNNIRGCCLDEVIDTLSP